MQEKYAYVVIRDDNEGQPFVFVDDRRDDEMPLMEFYAIFEFMSAATSITRDTETGRWTIQIDPHAVLEYGKDFNRE